MIVLLPLCDALRVSFFLVWTWVFYNFPSFSPRWVLHLMEFARVSLLQCLTNLFGFSLKGPTSKIKGLGQAIAKSKPTFWESPQPMALPMINHEVNIIMNINIPRLLGVGSGGFLHLLFNYGRDRTPMPTCRHKFPPSFDE